jgi:MFS family permease
MPETFHRDRFTWLAYLLLAFYSFFLDILGPITPFLKAELTLSYTVTERLIIRESFYGDFSRVFSSKSLLIYKTVSSNLHFTAFAVGILLVGLFGHILIQRIGHWHALWLGALGISVSALVHLGIDSGQVTHSVLCPDKST